MSKICLDGWSFRWKLLRCNFGNIFGHCKNIPWEMENDAHDKTLEEFCDNSFRSSKHMISNLKMIINFCVNPRRYLLII